MEWLQHNMMAVVVPLAIMAGMGILIKVLPALLEKQAMAALDALFERGDAADDAWLCATIAWAEAKYGAGSGAQKAAAVTNKIVAMLPVQYRLFLSDRVLTRAIELFQACFDRLEAVALKEAAEHNPPAA